MKSIRVRHTTPGGQPTYRQPETGFKVCWSGGPPEDKATNWSTTWTGLVTKVEIHRKASNATRKEGDLLDIDPGWADRLEHDFCEQNERLPCLEDGKSPIRNMTLKDVFHFMEVMRKWIAEGRPSVPHEQAEKRAEICADCQFNIRAGGCLGCGHMADFINLVSGSKPTKHDDQLQHCAHCGCANKAMVHFPLAMMAGEDLSKHPSFCWKITEANSP
jgi:hypothetical protein